MDIICKKHYEGGGVLKNQIPSYHLIRLDTPPRIYVVTFKATETYRVQYGRRDVPTFEIIFQQEGAVCERRGDQEAIFAQGSVRAMYLNRETELYCTNPSGCALFAMEFRLDQPPLPLSAEDVAQWSGSGEYAILPEYVSDPAVCEKIGTLLKSAHRLVVCRDRTCHLKLRTILHECLTILSEQAILQAERYIRHTAKIQSPYTKKALEFITANLEKDFTVMDIVSYVGISYEHLHRSFRQDMNMTITEYVNRTRIHRVEHHIVVHNMTLAQVGRLVGIRDVKYLSRLFHRFVGISPAEYRRMYGGRVRN